MTVCVVVSDVVTVVFDVDIDGMHSVEVPLADAVFEIVIVLVAGGQVLDVAAGHVPMDPEFEVTVNVVVEIVVEVVVEIDVETSGAVALIVIVVVEIEVETEA